MDSSRSPTTLDLFEASLAIIAAGQASSGAFVASPTFSQYPYAWLRDGAFVAEGLDLAGRLDRSGRFHGWVAGIIARSGAGMGRAMEKARRGQLPAADEYLHCRYDLDGRVADTDWPTFQLDGPGIWLWSLAHHARHGGVVPGEVREAARLAARYLAVLWPLPCADAWEESPEHVHTSTLAAIQAGLGAAVWLDRRLAGEPEVAAARSAIVERLSTFKGAFTKWSGSPAVDASLLWMAAPYETLEPTDPRFAATLSRVETDLITADGGVHRYREDTFYGGGAWPLLTAAYGRVLLRRRAPGDVERARAALRWIERQADEKGRLPEQVDDHAFAPQRIEGWRARWGELARPLLWSHAAYLALHVELEVHERGAMAEALPEQGAARCRGGSRRAVRPSTIVRFGPRRPWARPGEPITVDLELALDPQLPVELTVSLVDLDREIVTLHRAVPARPGGRDGSPCRHSVDIMLPPTARHGYGLRLRASAGGRTAVATSAVEAIDGWWQSPRHAAMTEFRTPTDSAAAMRDLAGWHVTVAQHYDWMWRHYRYRPPGGEDRFLDSLGREVSHAAVRAAVDAGHEAGVASLAYGSVYGAEPEYVQRHPDERVFDAGGEPLSLGGMFFINDVRAVQPWRRRLLREYRAAVRAFGFNGIHMDTYGPPHEALAADGGRLDFAELYPGLIDEAARGVAKARHGARVLFNCVDGFPLETAAASPVAALYLELWPPDRSFADVVRWVERATAVAAGRSVVIAAYAAALRGNESGPRRAGAFEASLLLGSVIAAAGAYHHTLAEGDRLLVEGYYPAAVPMRAPERRAMRALWTFGARYLHLLSDPGRTPADVNGLRLLDRAGMRVPITTCPVAGAVWAVARQLPDGRRVLHLLDLRDQADAYWDEPKSLARPFAGLSLEWPGLRRPVAASPWSQRGDARPLRSVNRPSAAWRLPAYRRWLMVVEVDAA